MNCEDAKYKIQALVDNELPEEEISTVLDHIQSCYRCRDIYIDFLTLQRKMKGLKSREPSKEWFEKTEKNFLHKASRSIGVLLLLGSYVLLLAFGIFAFFSDSATGIHIKLAVGGIVIGVLVLLGITLYDRSRERKEDKYKGVMK
ncbi:MAG: anti-sigma factor family protein [Spirochaetia bacterium]